MRLQIEGLNLHHKWSVKKPLGGKSSIAHTLVSHPQDIAVALSTGGLGGGGMLASQRAKQAIQNSGMNNNPGPDPAQNDADLISQKYADLATKYGNAAVPLRAQLASSLMNNANNIFKQENPFILEDLNSRGLSTSPTAVSGAQTQELGRLSTANTDELNNFDTDVFNNIQGINSTGTGSSLQRLFDVHDQAAQANLAQMLSRRQSRDSLTAALLGLGGKLGAAYIGN